MFSPLSAAPKQICPNNQKYKWENNPKRNQDERKHIGTQRVGNDLKYRKHREAEPERIPPNAVYKIFF
jgi:hypothetical protein